ncbi:MAG: sugar transferase [Chitinophagaceae bacterium]|nr:sugar transferase [Chitinophagaceae bacterium]
MYRNLGKPVMDFMIALILLLLLSPAFLLIALVLLIGQKGNPFFLQARPGKNGRLFTLIKFRTMTNTKDKTGELLPDASRMTGIGRFLRKTSLDEIPQLLNVLAGDMSLVGPRPLLTEYLPLYNSFQSRRHEVLPGITGWAQINGRNAISWQQKFTYDVWYVDHISLRTDLKIIFATIAKVFRSEGISVSTFVTMEKFTGNNE